MAKATSGSVTLTCSTMDIAHFLEELAEEVAARGVPASALATLEFNGENTVTIGVLDRPRPGRYPALESILDDVGLTCLAEGVSIDELRRIVFADDVVRVEVEAKPGDRPRWYALPIEAPESRD